MIEKDRIYRLIRNLLGDFDDGRFDWGVKSGWSFHPDLDIQDVATLARIASGEIWE